MTWSYTGNPATSAIDAIRNLVGDTLATDQQLQNEEITWALGENGTGLGTILSPYTDAQIYEAAVLCARMVRSRYVRRITKTIGDTKFDYTSLMKQYDALINDLVKQARRHSSPVPYVGGISESDKDIDESNDDMVGPNFRIGMDDNPGTLPNFNGTTTFTGAAGPDDGVR